jgi:4'-phosphopantetheinyl transferase
MDYFRLIMYKIDNFTSKTRIMPEIFTSIPLNSSNLWMKAWKIEEPIEFFQSIPSTWYEPILELKKTTIHQIESTAARYCLFEICKTLQIENSNLLSSPNGIPYFPNSEFEISITHSYPFVAAAVSRNKHIGIDLERKGRRINKIAPRFLSDNELKRWHHNDDLLTLAWSAKESIYKAYKIPGLSFQKSIILDKIIDNPMNINILKKNATIYWEEFDEFVLTVGIMN